jgi:type II secretory pathway pseudopilin PulG
MHLVRRQEGDTIMEVLVAIVVLSLILTISFSVVNRSTLGNRQAEERGEGFKYAASQIELLKSYVSSGAVSTTAGFPPAGTAFCMYTNGTNTGFIQPISVAPNAQNENFSGYQPTSSAAYQNCRQNERYYSYIVRTTVGGNTTFTAHTRWEKIGGGYGIDEATMVYRIYPLP